MAVAETIPLASDVVAKLASDTDCGVSDCQVTVTPGTGFPEASSTRAMSCTGKRAPGGPDWLLPSRMRSDAGWGWTTARSNTARIEVLAIRTRTGAGPTVNKSRAVAETIPLASDVDIRS